MPGHISWAPDRPAECTRRDPEQATTPLLFVHTRTARLARLMSDEISLVISVVICAAVAGVGVPTVALPRTRYCAPVARAVGHRNPGEQERAKVDRVHDQKEHHRENQREFNQRLPV